MLQNVISLNNDKYCHKSIGISIGNMFKQQYCYCYQ